ncbi:hypothetical protein SETIT_5G333500v2 [Setaria italica]|uniref:Uncharacterized protein n=1 Tax=Setaria italica TaxID=4555 RepID=A0A368RD83_SETIT|nr:hypothetical protein SETIT_5G333500v2 [Setaria italica]
MARQQASNGRCGSARAAASIQWQVQLGTGCATSGGRRDVAWTPRQPAAVAGRGRCGRPAGSVGRRDAHAAQVCPPLLIFPQQKEYLCRSGSAIIRQSRA